MKNTQINSVNNSRQQSQTLLTGQINTINKSKMIVDGLCRSEKPDTAKENRHKSTKSTNKPLEGKNRGFRGLRQWGELPKSPNSRKYTRTRVRACAREEHGMTERQIEAWLGQQVRDLGGLYYKWVSPGNTGVPDRIIILPGGVVAFVEMKASRGRLSPKQEQQLNQLRIRGCKTYVVFGEDSARALVDALADMVDALTDMDNVRGTCSGV